MVATSRLLLPPAALSGCLFAAIIRDTRGQTFGDRERLNYFPATPLVSVTHVAAGALRLISPGASIADARTAPPMPRTFSNPPQDVPIVSWSSGPVLAISVGVYPEAWSSLAEKCELAVMLERAFAAEVDVDAGWERFCNELDPVWREARTQAGMPMWAGARTIADWARALIARAALAGPGRGIRSIERRLRRWSGHTRQSLSFYADFENLHRVSVQSGDVPLAEIAVAAGFADQSHMGRIVRRATGFSPARLNQLIASDEAFWCYRLLGERF